MRTKLPHRIDVVRKEEKEANLAAFIRSALDNRRALVAEGGTDRQTYTVVARSPQSPVMLCLAQLATEMNDAGIRLRVILVQPILGADHVLTSDAARDLAPLVDAARLLRDIRFLDAHEQLWLDDETVWFGDCMRREPGKRDAYECFAPANPELARWGSSAFERLWQAGAPLAIGAPTVAVVPASGGDDAVVCPVVMGQGEAAGPIEASTRH